MSTIKSDSVIPVSGNTDLSLSGSGTGGVKVTDYFVQTKGSDIASATALTLGKDGNAFDITGTTTITSIGTQGIGSHITLQFDGILTFTHHSTDLVLPGAANITTAAGDIAVMYEYASGDWRCISYTVAATAPGGGGAWNLIGTTTASTSATLTLTGIDTTYDTYVIALANMLPASDLVIPWFRFGDSSSIKASGTDYDYWGANVGDNALGKSGSAGDSKILLSRASGEDQTGSASTEGMSAIINLVCSRGTSYPMITWHEVHWANTSQPDSTIGEGGYGASITMDRVQFLFASGNIVSGRMTMWGISHA